jgi:hypothetical protein
MKRDFLRLVRKYGRQVLVSEHGVDTIGMAFVQPMREKEETFLPTPLGRRRQGKLLCLSEPGLALEQADEEARLLIDGKSYRLLTARPEYLGEDKLFCWAILIPDEEGECV